MPTIKDFEDLVQENRAYMKLKLFIIFLLVLTGNLYCQIPQVAPSSPNKIEEVNSVKIEYFNSDIKISPIEPITLEGTDNSNLGLSLEVTFYIEGNKINTPLEVSFVFYSNNKVPRFNSSLKRKVSLLNNTKQIKSSSFRLLNSNKEKNFTHEVIGGEYSFDDFKKFIMSAKPKISIGKQIFNLEIEQISTLKSMIKIIDNK